MGLWKKLFSNSTPDTSQSDSSTESKRLGLKKSQKKRYIELQCKSCLHSYRVGLDAGVLTSGIWNQGRDDSLVQLMRQHDELLGDPDDVSSVSDPSGKLFEQEFNQVLDSLERGEKRRWRCGNCGKVKKYSKRAIKFT